MKEINTVNDLREHPLFKKENPRYFSQSNLRFFGEHIDEMEILQGYRTITDHYGKEHECVVLKSIQHNAPKGCPQERLTYFDIHTMERVYLGD